MADDNANLPAVQRSRAVVADAIPIFDTDRFEHYGRIAAVMARSTLVPATLREGDAVANCFQVVELADRWGYSPFAVAQCASVVYGKLMLEGKLVAAVLQSKLALKLNHYFTGEWGKDDYRIFVTDTDLDEKQVAALKPHVKLPGIRIIDGSAGEWKTKEKSGAVSGNWLRQPDMQLIYRGDRTWARAFESAVMLGVITEDEMEGFSERRIAVADQPKLTDGMGEAPKRARKPKEGSAAPEAVDEAKADPDASGAAGGVDEASEFGEDAHDAEFEDARPTETGSAPDAEPEPATSAPATDASGDGVEETSGRPDSSDGTSATSPLTQAPAEIIYTLAGEAPDEDGKVATYKNGKPFSRVRTDAKAFPQAYDIHATEIEAQDAREPAARDEPAAAAAPEGQPEPPTDAAAASPSDGWGQAFSAIAAAEGLLKAKAVLKAQTDAPPGVLERLRGAVHARYAELYAEGRETVQPFEDFFLMQIWLEAGAQNAVEIERMWTKFWRHDGYKRSREADQRAITDLMTRRTEELKRSA